MKILKLDEEQRIVYGWASVTTQGGNPVVDKQGDIIPTESLVDAVNDFMKGDRIGKVMHEGEATGSILHSLPITDEIAKALDIETDKQGWLIGYYVEDQKTWEAVKSGDYPAFSIGGYGLEVEVND